MLNIVTIMPFCVVFRKGESLGRGSGSVDPVPDKNIAAKELFFFQLRQNQLSKTPKTCLS